MRKIRLVLLGVLCAGLLVCGIGTGVTLAEVSTFSYGGQQLLESAQSRTQSLTVTLDLPECTVYLEDVPYGWGSDNRLMDVSRLEISSDIPAGTLRLDATYDSAGPELAVWTDFWAEGNQEWVHVSWQATDDLALPVFLQGPAPLRPPGPQSGLLCACGTAGAGDHRESR